MGHHKLFSEDRGESSGGDGGRVWSGNHGSFILPVKRPKMEVKAVGKILADILGISSVLFGWISNFDNVKSTVLFIVAISYLMVRLFFFAKRQMNLSYKEKQEAIMRDIDIQRKHQEKREKDIEIMERELSIRITGRTPNQRREGQ